MMQNPTYSLVIQTKEMETLNSLQPLLGQKRKNNSKVGAFL
jgi:hypothetical protein